VAREQTQDRQEYDAVVIGSGPNGLAAAITFAQSGRSVLLLEARETIGGGTRTKELTLPGFRHDVCSAIHPLALASPFFRSLDLAVHGLTWVDPPVPLAHPLDDGSAVLLHRSVDATAEGLGEDAAAYRRLIGPVVQNWDKLIHDLLKPLAPPRHPFALLRFGPLAMRSAAGLARARFKGERARALFAGNSCHSILPLEHWSTAAFGLMLSMLGHAVGWPIARGGSQAIADALASYLTSLGGTIKISKTVSSCGAVPKARALLFDVTPRQLHAVAGPLLPDAYRRRLESFRHGPGVFKVDWALDNPIPWKDPACLQAGTVHIGGTLEEIAAAELDVARGVTPERPFVLLSQPSLFDTTRAPRGMHTAWAYCHVPNGCTVDMTHRIEAQIERFAAGFHDRIVARHVMSPADMEAYNPNYIGGDIVGGVQGFRELFVRPLGQWRPYATPVKGIYICSSSMPPGGGVHGMCGYLAARKALRDVFGLRSGQPH
jgi:phytoene dehydrogenase-like protein